MAEMKSRPSFAQSFASALAEDAKDRGWRAFVPIYILGSVAIGAFAAWRMPAAFWDDTQWGVSATAFGGILAFNGLLLALGWSSFSKIYEIILAEPIGPILRKHGLLDGHLAFIDANHFVLVVAALFSGAAMVTTLALLPVAADRVMFGLAVAGTLYSLVRALASIKMMNELIWERAHIESEGGRPLQSVRGVA